MKEEFSDARTFLDQVGSIKKKYHISKVARSNDRCRRRIAALVRDEYLRLGGDIHQAFFLEADLYNFLRKMNLECDATPEERRLRELPRTRDQKGKRIDPLRLVSETYDPGEVKCYPFMQAILDILSEEEKNGIPRDNPRGRAPQTLEHLQKDARLFEKQKGTSLYRAD